VKLSPTFLLFRRKLASVDSDLQPLGPPVTFGVLSRYVLGTINSSVDDPCRRLFIILNPDCNGVRTRRHEIQSIVIVAVCLSCNLLVGLRPAIPIVSVCRVPGGEIQFFGSEWNKRPSLHLRESRRERPPDISCVTSAPKCTARMNTAAASKNLQED
jgi:hypothetical protein